jgi:glycosyltransferase involved in cell wall biosynthesis
VAAGAAYAQRVRLVKVVTSFETGGTERQFTGLSMALDADRFDLRVACLRREGPFLDAFTERGIPVEEFTFPTFFSAAFGRQVLRLARYLSRERVQVVQGYGLYGNLLAIPAARLAGVPVAIASVRDRGVYLTASQKRVQRFACQFADCVLANAESVREWLVEGGYDGSRIKVIRNGIDLARFVNPAPPAPGQGLRESLGLPLDSPVVVALARLNPSKGLDHLLDAAAHLAERHPAARFVFIGGGPDAAYRATLDARAASLGIADRVRFIGERTDVAPLLGQATISVLPSLSEALPNSVLESMAAGVPVVATRVGGIPEVIEDGVTGLLVPPGDSRALADAIGRLLDTPSWACAMGRSGRETAVQRFSTERMVRATEEVYEGLIARARRGRDRWNPRPHSRTSRQAR